MALGLAGKANSGRPMAKGKKKAKLNISISEFSKRKCASSSCSAQDLETKPNKLEEVDLDMVPMSVELEEEAHGLEEYTFPKFAATYFQGSSTHTHIRRQLRHPLLYHDDKDNVLVSCSLLFMLNLLSPQPWLYRSHHPWVLVLAQPWEPELPEPRRQSWAMVFKAAVPISIFWQFAGKTLHTNTCPMQDIWSTLFLPKEGTQGCVLTSPDTLWGQKWTGEKKHESLHMSLLLWLLVCEIGQKEKGQASNIPLNQRGIREGVFLNSK